MPIVSDTMDYKESQIIKDLKEVLDKHGVVLSVDYDEGAMGSSLTISGQKGDVEMEFYQEELDTYLNS